MLIDSSQPVLSPSPTHPCLWSSCLKGFISNSFILSSQIAHLDMHHLVSGINFLIHSVSLTSLVSIHLLIHLSTYLSRHSCSHHPSLLHSFTLGSKPTFSTNTFHIRLIYLLDCLTITGLDRTYHAHHFIFIFTFLIFCLFRVVD